MPEPDPIPAERWEGGTPREWQARWGVPALHLFHSVGSTNDVARALAERGAPAGTVVLADEQLRGRGRRGREWTARAGQSLLLSMVLRPSGMDAVSVLPLRIAVAVASAIEDIGGFHVGIKWPNDLVSRGRKLGGLLCEGVLEGDRTQFVIAGMGVNVRQSDDDWPPDLRGHATSIATEAGRTVPRATLAGRVVEVVSIAAQEGGAPLRPGELDRLSRRDVLRGLPVTVDGQLAGVAAGVDPSGALLVEADGAARRIIHGTVRAAEREQGVDEK